MQWWLKCRLTKFGGGGLRSPWSPQQQSVSALPSLPAPSDRHRLAYVCHVSIVMHGGAVAVAAAGRIGSVGRTYSGATNYYAKFGLISHSSITQNSRERTGRMRTRIEVYGRPKKLWSRLTTLIVLNNFSGMVHYMLNILVT